MSDNFDELAALAKKGASHSYSPYSQFSVGAAIQTKTGEQFYGCNVENASYGVGICAEQNAITTAVAAGARPGDINRLVLYIGRQELFSPCGACRQVMSEFLPPDTPVTAINLNGERKDWTMSQLLPDGFVMPD